MTNWLPRPPWPRWVDPDETDEPTSAQVVAELEEVKDRIESLIDRLNAFAEAHKP